MSFANPTNIPAWDGSASIFSWRSSAALATIRWEFAYSKPAEDLDTDDHRKAWRKANHGRFISWFAGAWTNADWLLLLMPAKYPDWIANDNPCVSFLDFCVAEYMKRDPSAVRARMESWSSIPRSLVYDEALIAADVATIGDPATLKCLFAALDESLHRDLRTALLGEAVADIKVPLVVGKLKKMRSQ